MVVTLVGTAAFKAVSGAGKVLAGFDSQTFPLPLASNRQCDTGVVGFFIVEKFIRISSRLCNFVQENQKSVCHLVNKLLIYLTMI